MRILITNDDGIDAPGIAALYDAAVGFGEVLVAAPASCQSAMGHGITCSRPIDVERRQVTTPQGAFEGYAIDAKPADCVKIAVAQLAPGPIDLVLSGINAGFNLGLHVFYSGTVAAAREAAFLGIPSVALSLHLHDASLTKWDMARDGAREMIARVLEQSIPPHTMLNINLPRTDDGQAPRGIRVTPASTSPMLDDFHVQPLGGERAAYSVQNGTMFRHTQIGSDVEALMQRFITVTPLHVELTHVDALARWQSHFETAAPAGDESQR